MIDKILKRHVNPGNGIGMNDNRTQDDQEIDDLGTFGFLRGSRERATMLELRRKDGSILAVAYGYIDKIEFDPTDGFTLYIADRKIRIKGRNLNAETNPKVRLFEAVCRHRVPWVREVGQGEYIEARDGDTIIESIDW